MIYWMRSIIHIVSEAPLVKSGEVIFFHSETPTLAEAVRNSSYNAAASRAPAFCSKNKYSTIADINLSIIISAYEGA